MGIFSSIAGVVLSSLDDAIETITYTPSGGSPLSIQAQVVRSLPKQDTKQNLSVSNMIMIYIAADDVPTVTVNADYVELYRNLGDASTVKLRVRSIQFQDAGSFTLLLGP